MKAELLGSVLLFSGALVGGCGDDDDAKAESPGGNTGIAGIDSGVAGEGFAPGGEAGESIDGPAEGAGFIVSMGVIGPEGATGLVFALDTLESSIQADRGNALEVPGAGFVTHVPDTRDFILANGDAPSLTRYTRTRDGFDKGQTFTLSGFGVVEPLRVVRVVDERSGWIAANGGQLFEFDPQAMEVTREVVLPNFERAGHYPAAASTYGRSFLRGRSLFFVYAWWGLEPNLPRAETALVHVDLDTGEPELSLLQGCGDLDAGLLDGAGNLWLAASGYAAAARVAHGDATSPLCLVCWRSLESAGI